MNNKIEQIKKEYGMFAKMGLAHMLTTTKQIFTEEEVAKEIEKIHKENSNENELISDGSMVQILLAARDLSQLDFDDLLQFVKDEFQTTKEYSQLIQKEENNAVAIKNLFIYFNSENEQTDNEVAMEFNELSSLYKIGWNYAYDSYSLIAVEDGYNAVISDKTLQDISDALKEDYPELYEEALSEIEESNNLKR